MRVSNIAVCVILVLASARASSRELYVDPAGGGDYTTITAAVDAAVDRDTVVVACGTYQDPRILIMKNISIRSETRDPGCVILDGLGTSRIMTVGRGDSTQYIEGFTFANGCVDHQWLDAGALGIDAYGATVRNCVFRNNVSVRTTAGAVGFRFFLRVIGCQFIDNTASSYGGAIYTPYGQLMARDCTFTGNQARLGGAICPYFGTTVLERCAFVDNRAAPSYGQSAAIHLWAGDCVIRNCSFVANRSAAGSASIGLLTNVEPATLTMENSIVAFDVGGGAVACETGSTATLYCCDLFGNAGGDWTGCVTGQLGANGNICADPLFCEPPAPGHPLTLHANSPCATAYSPCGQLIGSEDVGCDVSHVEAASWGRIKALYR